MQKPTIFFSHSSRDSQVLNRLKTEFCAKTGGAIEVFLSSDGQSIPFGRNWVYRVQEGLQGAALMIVFITPLSINSSWVYFEAGYSYSKGISVVPVGFLGVDLSKISPPLSLLQGFNITSADTLNNLIVLANKEFQHSHPLSFDEHDYENIVGCVSRENSFLGLSDFVQEIYIQLDRNSLTEQPMQLLRKLKGFLTETGAEHQGGDNEIWLRGATFSAWSDESKVTIEIDPVAFDAVFPTVCSILKIIKNDAAGDIAFRFKLAGGLDVVEESHQITARLFHTEICLAQNCFAFRDLYFRPGSVHYFNSERRGPAYIDISPRGELLNKSDTIDLVKLLLEHRVIYNRSESIT